MADTPPQSTTLPKLTPKQRRFVDAYTGEAHFNASEAARIAGYSDAGQSGWELKKKPEIATHIEARLDAFSASQGEVLVELRDVAFSQWRDHLTIRTDPHTGDTVDVRMDLGSKVKALELLGKAHQMFTDKQQIDLDGGMRVEIVGMADEELP